MKLISYEDLDRMLEADRPRPSDVEVLKSCRQALSEGNLDDAHLFAVQAVLVNWTNPEPYLLFAEIYGQRGHFPASIANAKKVIALAPDWPQGYLSLAEACRCCGDIARALDVLEQGARHIGTDPDLYMRLGELAARAHRRGLAANAFAQAALLTETAQNRATEAIVALIRQDGARAARLAPKLARRFGSSPTLRAIGAEALLVRGAPARALEMLDDGRATAEPSTASPLALKIRIRAMLDLGRPRRAMRWAGAALAEGSEDAQLLGLYALAARLEGRTQDALYHYDRALGKAQNDAQLTMGRALLLEHQGLLRESSRCFQDAAEQAPGDPEPQVNMARVLAKRADHEGAAESWTLAQNQFGNALTTVALPTDTLSIAALDADPDDWAHVLRSGILSDGERVAALHAFARAAYTHGRVTEAEAAWAEANACFERRIAFDTDDFLHWLAHFLAWQETAIPTTEVPTSNAFTCRPVIVVGIPGEACDELTETLQNQPGACPLPRHRVAAFTNAVMTVETTEDRADLFQQITALRRAVEQDVPSSNHTPFFVLNLGLLSLATTLLKRLFPDAHFVGPNQTVTTAVTDLYYTWRPTSEPWSNNFASCQKVINFLQSNTLLNEITKEKSYIHHIDHLFRALLL